MSAPTMPAPAIPHDLALDILTEPSPPCMVETCDDPATWAAKWHEGCSDAGSALYCDKCMQFLLSLKGFAHCTTCGQTFPTVQDLLGMTWRI